MSRDVTRPIRSEPAPHGFQIRNGDDGQVIHLTVHGDVASADLGEVEGRLLRLIAVRQPARLHLTIHSTTLRMSADQLPAAQQALADVGGVLVVTAAAVILGGAGLVGVAPQAFDHGWHVLTDPRGRRPTCPTT